MSSLFSACSDQMNLAHIVMQTATCQTPNRLQCTTHKPQCLVVHDQLSKGENKNVTQLDQESNFHFQTVLLFSFLHQTSLKSNVQIRWGFFFFLSFFFSFIYCRVTSDFIMCLPWCYRFTDDLTNKCSGLLTEILQFIS